MAKKKPDQLCWDCKRAVNCEPLTCPWAALGKPVDGWEAEKSEFNDWEGNSKIKVQTYTITKCPLFIQDRTETASVAKLWEGTGKIWWMLD